MSVACIVSLLDSSELLRWRKTSAREVAMLGSQLTVAEEIPRVEGSQTAMDHDFMELVV